MSKTSENGGLINNDNQPQQQPFDVVMNEHFGKYQSKGFKIIFNFCYYFH